MYGLPVTDRKVSIARHRYAEKMQHRPGWDFDAIYNALQHGRPLAEIGRRLKVTRQRMSQVYKEYFEILFPDTTAQERAQIMQRRPKQQSEKLAFVHQMAEECGCTVAHIEKDPHHLLINGARCLVSHVRNIKYEHRCGRRYSYCRLFWSTVEKSKFVIIVQEVEERPLRVFVIPTKDIVAVFTNSRRLSLYVPADDIPKFFLRSRLNWSKYADRWSLIRP